MVKIPRPSEPVHLKELWRSELEKNRAAAIASIKFGTWFTKPYWNNYKDLLERRGISLQDLIQAYQMCYQRFVDWVEDKEEWDNAILGLEEQLNALIENGAATILPVEKEPEKLDEHAVLRKEEVQTILRALEAGELESIQPTLDFEKGMIYPSVKKLTRTSDENIAHILDALVEEGFLSSEVVDNVAVCPECGSHRLILQPRCPSCGSGKLVKKPTIQHLSCGYYDFEENFRRGDRLICPKCEKPLRALGVDYIRPSLNYRCLSCGSFFPNPKMRHVCSNNHEFFDEEFTLKEVKAYTLNPAKKPHIGRVTLDIKSALQILEDGGFYVEAPTYLRGISGVPLEFSFGVWSNRDARDGGSPPYLVGEVFTSEDAVDVNAVLSFWAKSMDIEAKNKILVAVPGFDDTARNLAKSYNVFLLEGKSVAELDQKMRDLFTKLVSAQKK